MIRSTDTEKYRALEECCRKFDQALHNIVDAKSELEAAADHEHLPGIFRELIRSRLTLLERSDRATVELFALMKEELPTFRSAAELEECDLVAQRALEDARELEPAGGGEEIPDPSAPFSEARALKAGR